MIQIRPTRREDLPRIMELVGAAQRWFFEQGIDQWQDGYPTLEVFVADLQAGNSYVGLSAEGEILLAGTLSFDGEPTYAKIYEGGWLNEEPYAVIHRLVVDTHRRGEGLAGCFLEYAFAASLERSVYNMRVDTHRHNQPMQRLLERYRFLHCGRILLESGAEREAYQRLIP